jgi:hypothetical protein
MLIRTTILKVKVSVRDREAMKKKKGKTKTLGRISQIGTRFDHNNTFFIWEDKTTIFSELEESSVFKNFALTLIEGGFFFVPFLRGYS